MFGRKKKEICVNCQAEIKDPRMITHHEALGHKFVSKKEAKKQVGKDALSKLRKL